MGVSPFDVVIPPIDPASECDESILGIWDNGIKATFRIPRHLFGPPPKNRMEIAEPLFVKEKRDEGKHQRNGVVGALVP